MFNIFFVLVLLTSFSGKVVAALCALPEAILGAVYIITHGEYRYLEIPVAITVLLSC